MTAQILQEELVKEVGVIFRDDLFKDSAGEYIKMNVYAVSYTHLTLPTTSRV